VINHCSKTNPWFQAYLADEEEFSDFFVEWREDMDVSRVVRPRTSPLFHTYKHKEIQKKVWTTFGQDQVDLNYRKPEVLIKVIETLMAYLSHGASILRLDAVGFMWKESGTTCIHLRQTHQLIKLIKKVLRKVHPNVLILTETNVPHVENVSYFGQGDEADMVYNFVLPPILAYTLLSGDTAPLSKWLSKLEIPYKNVCFFNFLASHDGVGLRPVMDLLQTSKIDYLINSTKLNGGKVSYKSEADGRSSPYELNINFLSLLHGFEKNQEFGIRRFILAHAFLLAMPGVPAIYFHSISGSLNDEDGMEKSHIPRRINREKFDIHQLNNELARTDSIRNRIFTSIKKLILVRTEGACFLIHMQISRFIKQLMEC
jgi:glycosidase